jgi:UDP-sulfoquinovose synthase
MSLAAKGHDVSVIDNYLRRQMARQTGSEPLFDAPNLHERAAAFESVTGKSVQVFIGDCADMRTLEGVVQSVHQEAVIHYAEQASAPYSMRGYEEAKSTLNNNLGTTFNLIWAVLTHAPSCHIVKLGTMGEYGTPNVDIEEGWIDVTHRGRMQKFLYPRQAGSLYHTTKVLDTDLLWFYVRSHRLAVTDLMQGPVYGISTRESDLDERLLPSFHYDDIFGTVINRFLAQAVAGVPLTVYGKGGQTRGYLNIRDTLQCVELAVANPPAGGELRILNQFTETFTVNQLADLVQRAGDSLGMKVGKQTIDNPRQELEEHYYNPKHSGLLELGLRPHLLDIETMRAMLEQIARYKDKVDKRKILPRVRWTAH